MNIDKLRLDMIVNKNGEYFSCNNRRLCMFKYLYKNGMFDGKMECIVVNKCEHINECIDGCTDLHINYGNKPGKKCSEL